MFEDHRTIAHTASFDKEGAILAGSMKAFDEAIDAVTWSVSRDPFVHPTAEGTPFHIAMTAPCKGVPPLRVYFTVETDGDCMFRHVDAIPDEAGGF